MCRGTSQAFNNMYICEITSDDELDAVLPPSAPSDDGRVWHTPARPLPSSASQSPNLTATPLGPRTSVTASGVRNHPYQRPGLAHLKSVPSLNSWQGPSSLDNEEAQRRAPLFRYHSALSDANNGNDTRMGMHSYSYDVLRERRNSFSYMGEYPEDEQQQQRLHTSADAFGARRHWRSQPSEDHSVSSASSCSMGLGSPSLVSRSTGSDTESVHGAPNSTAQLLTPFSVDDILDNTKAASAHTSVSSSSTASAGYNMGSAYAMEARMAALTTADRPAPSSRVRALSDTNRRACNIMSPATAKRHWGLVARRRGASTSAKYVADGVADEHFTASLAQRHNMTDCRLDNVYEVTAKLERGLVDAAKVGFKLPSVPSSHRSLFCNTFSGLV